MITVYVSRYLQGKELDPLQFVLPQVPAPGSSFHCDDRCWNVDRVAWTQGDENFGIPNVWHAEIAVSA